MLTVKLKDKFGLPLSCANLLSYQGLIWDFGGDVICTYIYMYPVGASKRDQFLIDYVPRPWGQFLCAGSSKLFTSCDKFQRPQMLTFGGDFSKACFQVLSGRYCSRLK